MQQHHSTEPVLRKRRSSMLQELDDDAFYLRALISLFKTKFCF